MSCHGYEGVTSVLPQDNFSTGDAHTGILLRWLGSEKHKLYWIN